MKKTGILLYALLVLLFSAASNAKEIQHIDYDDKGDQDLINIVLDNPAEPKVFSLENPKRIVIDLNGFSVASHAGGNDITSDRIKSLRTGFSEGKNPRSRIVIDLNKDVGVKVVSKNSDKNIIIELTDKEDKIKDNKASPYKQEILTYTKGSLPHLSDIKRFYVLVNGKKLDLGKKAIFVKKNLLVPAKEFFEKAGFLYTFDQEKRKITAQMGSEIEVIITMGSNSMIINGYERKMSCDPKRYSGKIYIPLEDVARNISYGVVWIEKDSAVYCSPRIDGVIWTEEKNGKSLKISSSHRIVTFEYEEKSDPLVSVITIPNSLVDVDEKRIVVKDDEIMGIRTEQMRNDVKVIMYMSTRQQPKINTTERTINAFFPDIKDQGFQGIKNISCVTSETTDSITINMESAMDPRIFQLEEPPRIVLDFKDAKCPKGNNEIDAGGKRVNRIRWALNGVDQDSVRLVVDLIKDAKVDVLSEDAGKKLVIDVMDNRIRTESSGQKDFSRVIAPFTGDTMPKLFNMRRFAVFINGEKLEFGKSALFVKKNIMVPAKEFFERAGFIYSFDSRTREIEAQLGKDIDVRFKYNDESIYVNSVRREVPFEVKRYGGRIFIPLEQISRNIGYGFAWDQKDKILYISPMIKRIDWRATQDGKALEIECQEPLTTFEYQEKMSPISCVLTIPNVILATSEKKLVIKDDNVLGARFEQVRNNVKITVFLAEKQLSKTIARDNLLTLSFPPVIDKVTITEESRSIKVDVFSSKGMTPDVQHYTDPDRIIVDIPNALYRGPAFLEINKGGLVRMRASQFKAEPFVSRLVFDLAKETKAKATISGDNRHFSLYIEKQEVKIQETEKVKVLKNKVIVIDPGHGGGDNGAYGYSGENTVEKALNLKVALRLARILSDSGAIVQMTREDDKEISLASRVEFARNNNADIFISVHHNSIYKPAISGTETYYYNRNSKLLAKLIHNNMLSGLKRDDRDLSRVKFYVVYKNTMPSVLVEPLYLSNPEEEALAKDPDFQKKIAESIFNGIKQYFEVLKKLE